MNPDKLLTLLMGKCWHELEFDETAMTKWVNPWVCKYCGERFSNGRADNPPFSDPADRDEFFTWLCRERGEMWEAFEHHAFMAWISAPEKDRFIPWLFFSSPSRPRDLMAEWLRLDEVREKFGWVDVSQDICGQCEGGKDGEMCTNGKIRAEWAR